MKYLDHLKETYEQITKSDSDQTLWAKVYKIDTEGFKAKVQGVKGLIPFDKMPWHYEKESHWQAAAPHLIGKAYNADLLESDDESLKLSLSVENHSFTKKKYTLGQTYESLILEKTDRHLLVDTGLNSNFRNGSQLGIVSVFDFWDVKNFAYAKVGDKISLSYLNELDQGMVSLCDPLKYSSWYKQKPEKLIDTIVSVNVAVETGVKYFKTYDHFNSELNINSELYNEDILEALNAYILNLSDGDTIQCLVIGVSPKTNEIILKIHPELIAVLEASE